MCSSAGAENWNTPSSAGGGADSAASKAASAGPGTNLGFLRAVTGSGQELSGSGSFFGTYASTGGAMGGDFRYGGPSGSMCSPSPSGASPGMGPATTVLRPHPT